MSDVEIFKTIFIENDKSLCVLLSCLSAIGSGLGSKNIQECKLCATQDTRSVCDQKVWTEKNFV